ncbi:putative F-box domain, leucine-rich repeat domain, L domain-containing protein [Medicago truncatula]|uniref:F-box/LRR protein n=1 Tax=Medicago truncatula TaxID=3880 RepID=G7JFM9_MEDTR|nr:F-box/LRR protein [Medicago truncatula]RHN58458.1 putative F-box domain, leucine-rich repeat domain, L domain-containing protein [Medicago truncatula]
MLLKDFPQECWESIFKFLGQGKDLESVSMVCKKFLSITNQVKFSLTIHDSTILFLSRLLSRFLRLKAIDFSHFNGELEDILHQISQSGLDLDLINLSNQRTLPVDGLRELGTKMINLRVLICSNVGSLRDSHLVVIAYCFPFLEELDISFPLDSQASDFGLLRLSSMLENLCKIDLSGNHLITDKSLLSLCQNCRSLEEISFFQCFKISQDGIASAIRMRPSLSSISFNIEKKRIHGPGLTPLPINLDLIDSFVSLKRLNAIDLSNSFISDEFLISVADGAVNFLKKLVLQDCCNFTFSGIFYVLSKCQYVQSLDLRKADFLTDQCINKLSIFLINLTSINLSGCCQLTNSTFFILTRNCPLLLEIKMERTYIGVEGEEDSNSMSDFVVNRQVKAVHLGDNILLNDASLIKFTSICAGLQLLDLNACEGITGECVAEVMKRCYVIRHLNIAYTGIEKFEINFEVSQLKVLNLSGARIEDESLSIISKWCSGLMLLDIQNCWYVTAKGVREVIENCIALKELNLRNCSLVDDDFVCGLMHARPSLRKIITPSGVDFYG